jgi:uncharacterized integral membrane protein
MARKIINLVIFIPLAIVLVVFCVANRQAATLALNPFQPEDSVLALHAPLFVFLFAALILGMAIGGVVTWLNQGRHRKHARRQSREAIRWQAEADRHRSRAEQIAGHLPSK